MKVHFRLFLVVALCFSMSVWADTEVNVEVAGTLSSILSASDSKLKVTGVINGTDAKYLRQLVTSGGVTSLDLSGRRISNSSADVKKGIYIKNGRKFVITQ